MKDRLKKTPEHLRESIKKLFLVIRFGNYAEGIFFDNTGEHTIRGINLIDQLPLSEPAKEEVKKRFWPHDIPEIITQDFTVIQKQDRVLEQNLGEQEEKAAEILLNEQDRLYLAEFNIAKNVLKGINNENIPIPAATIAVITDRVEGNTYFHRSLAMWIISPEYDRSNLPPQPALTYTFEIHELFKQNIQKCKLQEEYKVAAEYLLRLQLDEVENAWTNVPTNRIPEILLNYLKEYSQIKD